MNIQGLDHYTLRSSKLQQTRDFYCRVVGLSEATARRSPFRAIGCMPQTNLCCIWWPPSKTRHSRPTWDKGAAPMAPASWIIWPFAAQT